ncbi:hypothetical protein MVLG_06516, partial [Microbotryum lychnidis-dioicae p1A1 Lamole]
MEIGPTLYSPPSQPLSDPISGLCDTLEAIEEQRFNLATSLDPSESNLEKLRDAVLNVSDVGSPSRSESPFSNSIILSGYLAKRPDIVRGSASLTALGPQYVSLTDKTMWTAMGEISSTRPSIPLVYLRGFPAIVREHLEYSLVFENKFPGSALEERLFRKRLEGLDLDLVVSRFYVGWTTRDVILRAQEDQELIKKDELGTQFGNYISSIGRGRVNDFNIFILNLPSTTIHRSQARQLTEQFEAFFIALLGHASLNSASGGTTTRWTADNGLFRWRDIISAPLVAQAQVEVIEAADSLAEESWPLTQADRDTANRRASHEFETAVRNHFQDFKEYFENKRIALVDPQNVQITPAYFEQLVLAACAVPFNRFGQIITMNVFEVPPASEFNGVTRFFGDDPGAMREWSSDIDLRMERG